MIPRPDPSSLPPGFREYVGRVPESDVLGVLEDDLEPTLALFREFDGDQLRFRYAEDKWSVQEILGHLVDSERILQVRALRFARGDTTELPGFDEDAYVEAADFDAQAIEGLIEEFAATRASSLSLFAGFTATAWTRDGVADGRRVGVAAFPWIVAGHVRHHLVVLRERYLPALRRGGAGPPGDGSAPERP